MGRVKHQEIKAEAAFSPVTLQDLIAENMAVFCWCHSCGHNAEVKADLFVPRFGKHYPVPELGVYVKCSKCRSKNVMTRPSWPQFGGQIARHG